MYWQEDHLQIFVVHYMIPGNSSAYKMLRLYRSVNF